ncbi:membrane protein of unknown function [Candidatus Hydrogenisulfobacillus filiaventi]|uniref:GDT1 family protein n=1 Tax=Candidatus Hydrogenisulfobacillus filiaventi TaxID=2707344 RepID=A0A6F8ZJ72_9FIRM|nr:membrane protein of unknown function [Candidatus Hydrogenisulfobacillus filiaventi]
MQQAPRPACRRAPPAAGLGGASIFALPGPLVHWELSGILQGSGEAGPTGTGWGPLAATFAAVFAAELPDKTSWVAIGLAAGRPGRQRAVWAGAVAAFGLQTALALAAGRLLTALPAGLPGLAAGLVFLLFGLHFLRPGQEDRPAPRPGPAALQAFLLVGLAEFGDLTQALTVAAVVRYPHAAWAVGLGAWAGLAAAAAVSVWGGGALARRLPEGLFHRLAAVVFLAAGTWLLGRWVRDRLW